MPPFYPCLKGEVPVHNEVAFRSLRLNRPPGIALFIGAPPIGLASKSHEVPPPCVEVGQTRRHQSVVLQDSRCIWKVEPFLPGLVAGPPAILPAERPLSTRSLFQPVRKTTVFLGFECYTLDRTDSSSEASGRAWAGCIILGVECLRVHTRESPS